MITTKRGQEGFSFSAILGLVIGIIALVVIALFIYGAFHKANTTLEFLPGEESTASQVCGLVASGANSALICDDFKKLKIGGKDAYVNCKYVGEQLLTENASWVSQIKDIPCNQTKAAKVYCKKLNQTATKKVTVNGRICDPTTGLIVP